MQAQQLCMPGSPQRTVVAVDAEDCIFGRCGDGPQPPRARQSLTMNVDIPAQLSGNGTRTFVDDSLWILSYWEGIPVVQEK